MIKDIILGTLMNAVFCTLLFAVSIFVGALVQHTSNGCDFDPLRATKLLSGGAFLLGEVLVFIMVFGSKS